MRRLPARPAPFAAGRAARGCAGNFFRTRRSGKGGWNERLREEKRDFIVAVWKHEQGAAGSSQPGSFSHFRPGAEARIGGFSQDWRLQPQKG